MVIEKAFCMNRKCYIICVVLFVLLQWPWAGAVAKSFIELPLAMVLSALLLSNIFGLVLGCVILFEAFPDIWLNMFDNDQWLLNHSHSIGSPGVSYEAIFWSNDIVPILLAIFISLYFYASIKRCKYLGLSPWWCFVPLYNPIALLLKEPKKE